MDNAYAIRFQGNPRIGEPFVFLGTEPAETGITTFDNHLLAGPSQGRDSAYIYGTSPSPLRTLRGTYPAGHWEFRIRGSLPDPGWTLTRELRSHLVKQGLRVQEASPPLPYQPPQTERMAAAQTHLASWTSPPLRDLLRRMLIFSDNHVAAHLFAQAAKATGRSPSREGGIQTLQASLMSKKLDASKAAIYDGMGLSPLNRLSPELFTAYLQKASSNAATFEDLLGAMAGGEGSEDRVARYGQGLKGRLWVKTGTLEGVAALAGFIKTRSGKMVCFAVFANHFTGKSQDVQAAFGPLLQQWQNL
jgi:serine-type D-Ala-D-Ala carboxypeptidase/endopeptidase (penicillin-binding protein 4)